MYLKYVIVLYFINMMMTGVASVLFGFLVQGQFDVNRAFHPFQFVWVSLIRSSHVNEKLTFLSLYCRLPWNQNTILGYFAELTFGILSAEAYLIAIGSLLLLFISLCQHFQGFYQMYQHLLNEFVCPTDMQITRERLCKLIKSHISVKECVKHFSQ